METTALSIEDAAQSLINVEPEAVIDESEESTTDEVATEDVTDDEAQHDDEVAESEDYSDEPDEEEEEATEDVADDIEDDSEQEDADLASSLYTVKVDGEDVQVSLDDLKQGYSGQQYVQKGMKQAAEARKQAEAVYNSFLQARNEVLSIAENVKSGKLLNKPVEPSRQLFDTDPIGYMEAKLKYDDDVGVYNQQMEGMQHMQAQHSQAEQQAKQQLLQHEAMQLKTLIPELSDPTKAEKWKEGVTQAATHYGYTSEDIGGIVDHRAMRVLSDAMKYREIMNGKQNAQVKAKGAKPIVKAGSKRNVDKKSMDRKRQEQKLHKSGKIEDAISLIMNI